MCAGPDRLHHLRGEETASSPTAAASIEGAVSRTFENLAPFTGVKVEVPYAVTITQGDTQSVTVTTAETELDKFRVTVVDGVLSLGTDGQVLGQNLVATIVVTELTSVSQTGASFVTLEGPITADTLEIEVSGASVIGGDVTVAGGLEIQASGASQGTLTGEAGSLTLSVAEASRFDALSLSTATATVTVAEASSAAVRASETVTATAREASSIEYAGNPATINRNADETSSIEPASS